MKSTQLLHFDFYSLTQNIPQLDASTSSSRNEGLGSRTTCHFVDRESWRDDILFNSDCFENLFNWEMVTICIIFCYKFFRSELFQNVEKYNNLYMFILRNSCCGWSLQSKKIESTCLQQFPFRHPHPRASDCSLCFTTVVLSFQQKWNFVGNDSIPPVLIYLSVCLIELLKYQNH